MCNDYFTCPHCGIQVNVQGGFAHVCRNAPQDGRVRSRNGARLTPAEVQAARIKSGLAPSERLTKLLGKGAEA